MSTETAKKIARKIHEHYKRAIATMFGETPARDGENTIRLIAEDIASDLSRLLGAREHELRELRAELETRIRHSDGLFASLESSQAECQRIVESLNSAGIVREKLRVECERLRKDKERLDWVMEFITQNGAAGMAKLIWSQIDPEEIMEDRIDLTFDRAGIDAAMQPSETKEKP